MSLSRMACSFGLFNGGLLSSVSKTRCATLSGPLRIVRQLIAQIQFQFQHGYGNSPAMAANATHDNERGTQRQPATPTPMEAYALHSSKERDTLTPDHINALRTVVRQVCARHPLHTDEWVVLPDHPHCVRGAVSGRIEQSYRGRRCAFPPYCAIPITIRSNHRRVELE